MIKVHHLNNSRSQRILWLLEELGLPYEIVPYKRDAVTNLAPPELKAIHPLGKSPVITDGDLVVAESGAIVEYLVAQYGKGSLVPPNGSPAQAVPYHHWLHFAEGSAMLPFLLALYLSRLNDAAAPLMPRVMSEIMNHLGYMEASLGDKPYFLGDEISPVDIQLSFVVEAAESGGAIAAFPNLAAYAARIHARPAYQAAIAKGGPYKLGR
jgi:glutathione S-transferase